MNNKIKTIKEITEKLLFLETKYDLLNLDIQNVKVWQCLRVLIYEKIQASIINIPPINDHKSTIKDIISTKFFRLKTLILQNPFLDRAIVDSIIFESSRKYLVDGEYIDIYTKYLKEELQEKKKSYTIYQTSANHGVSTNRTKRTFSIDYINFKVKHKKKSNVLLICEKDYLFVKNLERDIYNSFSVKFDLINLFIKEVQKFKIEYNYYYKLLKRKKIKKIFFIAYNGKAALIKAAKDLKIESIEIQHGIMVAEDFIYHFPGIENGSLEYFPKKFYVWNKQINTCKLPIAQKNIIIYGNKFLENRKSSLSGIPKIKNQILIISQHTLSKQIADFILKNLLLLKDYKIIYKLHPLEEKNVHEFLDLKMLKTYTNFIIADNNYSVYELMAQSQFVIGVYSTALYEATYFNCIIFLINLPGVEMLNHLVNNKSIKEIEKDDILINLID